MSASYSTCSLLSFDNIQEEKNMEMVSVLKIKAENANVSVRAWRSVKRVGSRFLRRKRKRVLGLSRRAILASLQVKRKVCRILQNTSVNGCRHELLNYDMNSYSKNFDDGRWQQEEVEYYRSRSFAYRYGKISST